MRVLAKAFQNIRRTPYQSSAAVLVLSTTFFVAILILFVIISLRQALAYLESQPQMLVFFEPATPESVILELSTSLQARTEIAEIIYVSQEEALRIYTQDNQDDPQLLQLVSAEILPASLEISTVSIDFLRPLAQELEARPEINEISFPEFVVDRLKTVITGIRYVGGAFVGVMVMTSFLIISIVVGMKISNRQFEIRVMRLMGASNWFIQGPYLLEGAIYGFISSNIGYALVLSLVLNSSPYILRFAKDVPLIPQELAIYLSLYAIAVVSGVLIGMVGSLIAVTRFNRT